MGSSGAGKTTLLDVLAKRKTIGTIEGTILLNGERLHKDFERITGYVEQMGMLKERKTGEFILTLFQMYTIHLLLYAKHFNSRQGWDKSQAYH